MRENGSRIAIRTDENVRLNDVFVVGHALNSPRTWPLGSRLRRAGHAQMRIHAAGLTVSKLN
jgi:hypothetical protein